MRPFVCLERVHFRTIWLCRGLIRKHNVCALAVMWRVLRTHHNEPFHLCGPRACAGFPRSRGRLCKTDTVCIDPSCARPACEPYYIYLISWTHPFHSPVYLIMSHDRMGPSVLKCTSHALSFWQGYSICLREVSQMRRWHTAYCILMKENAFLDLIIVLISYTVSVWIYWYKKRLIWL